MRKRSMTAGMTSSTHGRTMMRMRTRTSLGRMGKTMTKIVTRLLAQGVVDGVFVPELVMIREKQP
ncbi:hypothetical protein, partial [Duodenibacillus massiliensis]|uniref:hypothetical protein n=1 Tax=Duodenibacillus massiliensis TaxID=1852381 RepID=UPI002FDA39F5